MGKPSKLIVIASQRESSPRVVKAPRISYRSCDSTITSVDSSLRVDERNLVDHQDLQSSLGGGTGPPTRDKKSPSYVSNDKQVNLKSAAKTNRGKNGIAARFLVWRSAETRAENHEAGTETRNEKLEEKPRRSKRPSPKQPMTRKATTQQTSMETWNEKFEKPRRSKKSRPKHPMTREATTQQTSKETRNENFEKPRRSKKSRPKHSMTREATTQQTSMETQNEKCEKPRKNKSKPRSTRKPMTTRGDKYRHPCAEIIDDAYDTGCFINEDYILPETQGTRFQCIPMNPHKKDKNTGMALVKEELVDTFFFCRCVGDTVNGEEDSDDSVDDNKDVRVSYEEDEESF